MKALTRHHTLRKMASAHGWDWFYGPDWDKAHRHQLYHDGLLYKTLDVRRVIPYASGSMLIGSAFSVSVKGIMILDQVFDDLKLRTHLVKALLTDDELLTDLKKRERSYRYGRDTVPYI